jgi:hypothetical protein
MSLTLVEIEERLKDYDEVTLLERLEITSEEIVEKFQDKIEEHYEEFAIEFTEEEDEFTN